jgi:hypothetical protein
MDTEHGQPCRVILAFILILLISVTAACFFPDPAQQVGISGESFILDDQYIIVINGYDYGDVTWVVVRNWPATSTAEERSEDDRFIDRVSDEPQVRLSDGTYKSIEDTSYLYFFDGYTLTAFPISMQEDDLVIFQREDMDEYTDVMTFFAAFRVDE